MLPPLQTPVNLKKTSCTVDLTGTGCDCFLMFTISPCTVLQLLLILNTKRIILYLTQWLFALMHDGIKLDHQYLKLLFYVFFGIHGVFCLQI